MFVLCENNRHTPIDQLEIGMSWSERSYSVPITLTSMMIHVAHQSTVPPVRSLAQSHYCASGLAMLQAHCVSIIEVKLKKDVERHS